MSQSCRMLEVTSHSRIGNVLTLQLKLVPYKKPCVDHVYTLCGVVRMKVKCDTILVDNHYYRNIFTVVLSKNFVSDSLVYDITVKSDCITFVKHCILKYHSDNSIAVGELLCELNTEFVIQFELEVHSDKLFHVLYEDNEFTDFELRGEDGSVSVHKLVLINHSPVLRSMLSGEWKEVKSGSVEIPKVTEMDLQRLKDYLYLQKVTDFGVEQLTALAHYYMMSDLKQRCAIKLINKISAGNVINLMELAIKYNVKTLLLVIFERIKDGTIKIEDIDKCCTDDDMVN